MLGRAGIYSAFQGRRLRQRDGNLAPPDLREDVGTAAIMGAANAQKRALSGTARSRRASDTEKLRHGEDRQNETLVLT